MTEYTNPFRAYVERNYPMGGVSVWLVDRRSDRVAVMLPHDPVFRQVEDQAIAQSPSLRLTEEFARALLDALAAYFGGTGEVQTLRKDYDTERKRSDRLIEALISVATRRPT